MSFHQSESHVLVRIEPTDDKWGDPVTNLLSDFVAELVFKRIRLYYHTTICQSLDNLLRYPNTRGWAGKLFEQAVHRRFRRGIKFSPQVMGSSSAALDIQIDEVNDEAECYFHTLAVRTTARSRKVAVNFLNQYLIPLSSTAETIDSVYISRDVTVFFQITVSPSHDLNLKGITELTDELPHDAKKRVCIVFVLPDRVTTVRPYKRQKIVSPAGVLNSVAEGYPQYVFYVDMNDI